MNLIQLPTAYQMRQMHAVRRALAERARYVRAQDPERRHAVYVAFTALASGSSSGWATQAGIQALRRPAAATPGLVA